MPELAPHEIEVLRRSLVMTPSGQPSGLSRDGALALVEQLKRVTDERDRLRQELSDLGYG